MSEPLLTPTEVGALFGVTPKTVTRWAIAGKLPSVRTFGGHHRFQRATIEALVAASNPAETPKDAA